MPSEIQHTQIFSLNRCTKRRFVYTATLSRIFDVPTMTSVSTCHVTVVEFLATRFSSTRGALCACVIVDAFRFRWPEVTSYYVENVVACVAIMQPCFVWKFVYFSGSQHLLSFVTLFFLFLFLCEDLMLRF